MFAIIGSGSLFIKFRIPWTASSAIICASCKNCPKKKSGCGAALRLHVVDNMPSPESYPERDRIPTARVKKDEDPHKQPRNYPDRLDAGRLHRVQAWIDAVEYSRVEYLK